MDCYSYKYCSCSYVELLPIHKKWYPKGKKIVPKDIVLTPLTLRQWYIGDGCLIKSKNANPRIRLYTNCFSIKDVEWLRGQLKMLGFKTTRRKINNEISISTYSTKNFIESLGKCPVKCYQYKFDYGKRI